MDNCIDLISFLRNYYGINSDSLKINKITHMDIKILFPNIKRASYEMINNDLSLIYNGDIILVYDCLGKIIPYINPHLKLEESAISENNYAEFERMELDDLNISKLSKEELLMLRRKLKKNYQYSEERLVVKEIRKKKDYQVIDYKRRKERLRMEEF